MKKYEKAYNVTQSKLGLPFAGAGPFAYNIFQWASYVSSHWNIGFYLHKEALRMVCIMKKLVQIFPEQYGIKI